MSNLDEIRERDRRAIPRMGDPENDPLLRAEMDRRWLLREIDRLTEACPFGLEGHILCDCATHVREQVQRVEDLARRAGAGFTFPEEQIVTVREILTALGGDE